MICAINKRIHMSKLHTLVLALVLALLQPGARAGSAEATQDMLTAAKSFLATLTPDQKAKAMFEFAGTERQNWHFIPKERKGLPLKEMTIAQRHLATALLASAMSSRGMIKATTIMSLEQILLEMEQGKGPLRDPERYFFSIFGTPTDNGTWGWRCEGHHMSLNFSLVDGKIAGLTPSFMGSNPGEVRVGDRAGLRVLAGEEFTGRALVTALTPDQQSIAIYTNVAPADVINLPDREAKTIEPLGISAAKLNPAQQQMLLTLIEEYVRRYRPELADADMAKIKAEGWEKIHFAWAGSMLIGQPHYYRVQGTEWMMEYDNTQNNANHVHASWRDLNNDFGGSMLKRHYQIEHNTK